tara:strand:- start:4923 stop:5489 length:567 start_codon:yes stop_codon:yes gene_type:complete
MNTELNLFIDPSHSKCSLLDIIKHSNMDINKAYLYTKDSLLEILISHLINNDNEISFYDPHYPFNNKKEFIQWLGRAPDKLTGADKQNINIVAKEVILFCKSGYDFSKSRYNTYEEIEEALLKVKEYGTISYVRTAVKLFNLTRDIHNQIDCKVPLYIHNQIMLKKHYKDKCVPVLQVKYGSFKLDFS